jgi:hypothetical protein
MVNGVLSLISEPARHALRKLIDNVAISGQQPGSVEGLSFLEVATVATPVRVHAPSFAHPAWPANLSK